VYFIIGIDHSVASIRAAGSGREIDTVDYLQTDVGRMRVGDVIISGRCALARARQRD